MFNVDCWGQYESMMQGDRVYTTNGAEGYNNAFAGIKLLPLLCVHSNIITGNTGSSTMNASLWSTITHIVQEESVVRVQWAENLRQPMAEPVTEGRKKRVHQKVGSTVLCLTICMYASVLFPFPVGESAFPLSSGGRVHW